MKKLAMAIALSLLLVGGALAASTRWAAICQWCGKRGTTATTSNGTPPHFNPSVPGKCPSHPSGNPNANHGPQWQRD